MAHVMHRRYPIVLMAVLALLGAMLRATARADAGLPLVDCSAAARQACELELGQAATGLLATPEEVNVWRLHLDGPGALYILLTDAPADLVLVAVSADGSYTGESQRLSATSAFLAVPEASAGDYVLYVRSRWLDPETVATYLLLPSWQPAVPQPDTAAVAAPPIPASPPAEATPRPTSPPAPPPAPTPASAPYVQVTAPQVSRPAPIVLGPLPPPPPRPPLPPAGLRATAASWHTIRLDWTNRSDNVTALFIDGTAGYHPVPVGATTANVGGLSPSTRYCFRVIAVNEVGEATSNEACATTRDQPPGR